METSTVILLIINGLFGVVLMLAKNSYNDIKENIKAHSEELSRIKDTYFKKEDFREFKEELWMRLDRMQLEMERRIGER